LKTLLAKDPTLANSFRWTSTARDDRRSQSSRVVRSDTALTAALKARRGEVAGVVDLLLSSGADPNLAVDSGDVPLDALARGKHRDEKAVALARLLVARGARLGPRPGQDGGSTTPLETLLSAGAVDDEDGVGLLRLYASDASALGATDTTGRTALHAAAGRCSDRAIEVLLEAGADPNARTATALDSFPSQRAGDTPLHWAAACGGLDPVFTLCAGGGNPRLKNSAGEIPQEILRRMAKAEPARFYSHASNPREVESIAAALAPDGPCGDWYGRFLREGRPTSWKAVRLARLEQGCTFDSRTDCGDLGWAYEKGEGAPVDFTRAMAAYRKACDLKGAWACGMVGILHDNGEGLAEDPVEAARWFMLGCDGDVGQCCARLAGLARDGRGIAQDRTRALALFDKACVKQYQKGCEGALALR
jgi:ankyrin repeat protein